MLVEIKEFHMHRLHLTGSHEDLGHMAHHMSNLMRRVLHTGFTLAGKSCDWTPAVDICETADRYDIIVELAGVRREEIEVYTENHYLTIAGWRGDPAPRDKVCVHQMEIEQGQFCRRLHLPEDADEAAVSARHREGFLLVTLPKRKEAPEKPRRAPQEK